MYKETILSFLFLLGSLALGQSTATPSQKQLINELESSPPASQPNRTKPDTKQKSGDAVTPSPNIGTDSTLGSITSTALDQHVTPATALTNDELLARGKTIFVISHTFFVKKEQLESGLINRKELADWGFHVVQDMKTADFILKVKRAPFQNNFPFTLSDRASGIVLLGGTVNSLFGTVPGKISARLVEKLKQIYKGQQK